MFLNWKAFGPDFSPFLRNQELQLKLVSQILDKSQKTKDELDKLGMTPISGLPNDVATEGSRALQLRDELESMLSSGNENYVMRSPEFRQKKQELVRLTGPVSEIARQADLSALETAKKATAQYDANGRSASSTPYFDQNGKMLLGEDGEFLTRSQYERLAEFEPDWVRTGNRAKYRPSATVPDFFEFTERMEKNLDASGMSQWEKSGIPDGTNPMTQLGYIAFKSQSGQSNESALRSKLDLVRSSYSAGDKQAILANFLQSDEYSRRKNEFRNDDGALDQGKIEDFVFNKQVYSAPGRFGKNAGKISWADRIAIDIADSKLKSASGSGFEYKPLNTSGDGSGSEKEPRGLHYNQMNRMMDAVIGRDTDGSFKMNGPSEKFNQAPLRIAVPYTGRDGKVSQHQVEVPVSVMGDAVANQLSMEQALGLPDANSKESSTPIYPSAAPLQGILAPSQTIIMPNGGTMSKDVLQSFFSASSDQVQIQGLDRNRYFGPQVDAGITDPSMVDRGMVRGVTPPQFSSADGNEMPYVSPELFTSPTGHYNQPYLKLKVSVSEDFAREHLQDLASKEAVIKRGGSYSGTFLYAATAHDVYPTPPAALRSGATPMEIERATTTLVPITENPSYEVSDGRVSFDVMVPVESNWYAVTSEKVNIDPSQTDPISGPDRAQGQMTQAAGVNAVHQSIR